MVATQSTMIALGTPAPDFALPDIDRNIVKRNDFTDAPALLVSFICNHCPYVIHIREHLVELIREYQAQGVAVVAMSVPAFRHIPGCLLARLGGFEG